MRVSNVVVLVVAVFVAGVFVSCSYSGHGIAQTSEARGKEVIRWMVFPTPMQGVARSFDDRVQVSNAMVTGFSDIGAQVGGEVLSDQAVYNEVAKNSAIPANLTHGVIIRDNHTKKPIEDFANCAEVYGMVSKKKYVSGGPDGFDVCFVNQNCPVDGTVIRVNAATSTVAMSIDGGSTFVIERPMPAVGEFVAVMGSAGENWTRIWMKRNNGVIPDGVTVYPLVLSEEWVIGYFTTIPGVGEGSGRQLAYEMPAGMSLVFYVPAIVDRGTVPVSKRLWREFNIPLSDDGVSN